MTVALGQSLLALLEERVKPEPFSYTRRSRTNAVYNQHWKLMHDTVKDEYELYNLLEDPKEKNNRYETEQAIAKDLRIELERFY